MGGGRPQSGCAEASRSLSMMLNQYLPQILPLGYVHLNNVPLSPVSLKIDNYKLSKRFMNISKEKEGRLEAEELHQSKATTGHNAKKILHMAITPKH